MPTDHANTCMWCGTGLGLGTKWADGVCLRCRKRLRAMDKDVLIRDWARTLVMAADKLEPKPDA